ncbi:hypothetical protein SAY86_015677 [Trapa natans]|uniref:Pentatricopeptide repeat-containing protein n=1 Tax=Trapa natans TaxID=22666 RepID=A0AAN7LAX9_TRANT|nr:hypothetical protein SAY86_015677 [Trapa natans]
MNMISRNYRSTPQFSALTSSKVLGPFENPSFDFGGRQEKHVANISADPVILFNNYKRSRQYTISNTRILHAQLLRKGVLFYNTFIARCLLDCYCKCTAMEYALNLFDKIPSGDVVSWNMIISGYNQQARFLESWDFFCRMRSSSCEHDDVTYGSILSACTALQAPILGMLVYSVAMKNGFFSSGHVRSGIIDLLAKNYMFEDALRVFKDVPQEHNVVCWNAVISAAVANGENQAALAYFQQMCHGALMPNSFTFSSVVTACTAVRDLQKGKAVHGWIVKCNSEDIFVGTSLIDLYAKCSDMDGAMKIFMRMPSCNVVSWTAIISGFAQKGDVISAMQIFREMRDSGEEINEYTLTSMLTACSKSSLTTAATQIHGWIIKFGFESYPSVVAALIIVYSKDGDIDSSESLFKEMESFRNSSSWDSMISAFAKNNKFRRAIEVYRIMLREGLSPDMFSMSSVLSVVDTLDLGIQVHSQVIKSGLIHDVSVCSSLFTMYSKCGSLHESYEIFKRLDVKDNLAWASMISGFSEHGHQEEAVQLFIEMLSMGYELDQMTINAILTAIGLLSWARQGKEIHAIILRLGFGGDTIVGSSLVTMYSKCCLLILAKQVFDSLPQRDAITSASLISGYTKNGQIEEAVSLFQEMLKTDFSIDSFSVSPVLGAVTLMNRLDIGMQLHSYVTKLGLDRDASVGSSLVSMYSKCGSIDDCINAFDQITTPDLVGWTAMIMGYARHGKGDNALRMFEHMKTTDITPDPVTFVAVLSACSHNGLVEEGYSLFNSMVNDYGIEPNNRHYACMVDLLGRAGKLKEAERFISDMPFKPNAFVWGTLLAACRVHGDIELGNFAARKVVESEPGDSGAYISLSNIFAGMGQWEDVVNIREFMKGAGARKEPGWSIF